MKQFGGQQFGLRQFGGQQFHGPSQVVAPSFDYGSSHRIRVRDVRRAVRMDFMARVRVVPGLRREVQVRQRSRIWRTYPISREIKAEIRSRAWVPDEFPRVWRLNVTKSLELRTGESVVYDIDLTDMLASAEVVLATPTAPAFTSDPEGLTLTFVAVNAAAITYKDGRVAAIGKVIQVRIADGAIPGKGQTQEHVVKCAFHTSLLSNLMVASVKLVVSDNP